MISIGCQAFHCRLPVGEPISAHAQCSHAIIFFGYLIGSLGLFITELNWKVTCFDLQCIVGLSYSNSNMTQYYYALLSYCRNKYIQKCSKYTHCACCILIKYGSVLFLAYPLIAATACCNIFSTCSLVQHAYQLDGVMGWSTQKYNFWCTDWLYIDLSTKINKKAKQKMLFCEITSLLPH